MKDSKTRYRWFNFYLNETQRRLFFLFSIVGSLGSLFYTIRVLNLLFWNINFPPNFSEIYLLRLISEFIFFSLNLGYLAFCLYTYKKTKKKHAILNNSEKERGVKWLGFILSQRQALVIFIISILIIYIEIRFLALFLVISYINFPFFFDFIFPPFLFVFNQNHLVPGICDGYILISGQIILGILIINFIYLLYTIRKVNNAGSIQNQEIHENMNRDKLDFKLFDKNVNQNQAVYITYFSVMLLIVSTPVIIAHFLMYIIYFLAPLIKPIKFFTMFINEPIFFILNACVTRHFLFFLLIFLFSFLSIKDILNFPKIQKKKAKKK
ncbi:MAG: hypothetical protein GF329_01920 [Candidatus Lokiarchaeota archaeon]|nr:hypothetical protein [Candidatus Lokiarchaeota archaeon]